MKTLFLKKEIRNYDPQQIGSLLKALDFPQRALMRSDEIEAAFIRVGKDPSFSDILTALNVPYPFTKPSERPTFRFCTIQDLINLWVNKAMFEFISGSHIFDGPADKRGVTYNTFYIRYQNLKTTWFRLKYSDFDFHFKRLCDLVHTAYWNVGITDDDDTTATTSRKVGSTYDAFRDRIDWAKGLLEPIMCTQFLVLGEDGASLNSRQIEDTTYTQTIDFWMQLIDPEYFQYVGSNVLQLDCDSLNDMRYNTLSIPLPMRIPYNVFSRVLVSSSRVKGTSSFKILQADEVNDIPHLEQLMIDSMSELSKRFNEDVMLSSGFTVYAFGKNFYKSIKEELPNVRSNIPYTLVLLAAMIDLVQMKEPEGCNLKPQTHYNYMTTEKMAISALIANDRIKSTPVYSFDEPKLAPVKDSYKGQEFPNLTEGIRNSIKGMIMWGAPAAIEEDKLTEQQTELVDQIGLWMLKLASWAKQYVPKQMILCIPTVRNDDLPAHVLTSLGVEFDRHKYDILIEPTRYTEFKYADIYQPTVSTSTIGASAVEMETVQGFFRAFGLHLMLSAPYKPIKSIDFPRSTMWRGDGLYIDSEFETIIGSRREAVEKTMKVGPSTKPYSVGTPLRIATNIRMVRDYHFGIIVDSYIAKLEQLYADIHDHEMRKQCRRAFIKSWMSLGKEVKTAIGVTRATSYNKRNDIYYDLVTSYAYAIWYFEMITKKEFKKSFPAILSELDAKDFERWVDAVMY